MPLRKHEIERAALISAHVANDIIQERSQRGVFMLLGSKPKASGNKTGCACETVITEPYRAALLTAGVG